MVEITETDDSKVNSHHRYTGAVRVDFPRGEDTVDVDEETARTAVNTYETVEFADELVEQHEDTAEAQSQGEVGKKAETRTHQNAAEVDSDADADAEAQADTVGETRESRSPHAQSETADGNDEDEPTPGEAP